MRVLMLGWEFPPHISGGLGTACHGLVKGLLAHGVEVTFVVPRRFGDEDPDVTVVSCDDVLDAPGAPTELPATVREAAADSGVSEAFAASGVTFGTATTYRVAEVDEGVATTVAVDSLLSPYLDAQGYTERRAALAGGAHAHVPHDVTSPDAVAAPSAPVAPDPATAVAPPPSHRFHGGYGPHLLDEVARYAEVVAHLAAKGGFDVIHAHDWMTYAAGLMARQVSGKPLIVHAHALEYDRSGDDVDTRVRDLEGMGLREADLVIAVSHLTKRRLCERYDVDPAKVRVVHNAVEHKAREATGDRLFDAPVVLFLGRITFQKGPEYFLRAAAKVVEAVPDVKFVMAGSGDLFPKMVERAAELGLARHVHFTGFLRGREVERMYAMADVYLMPSVSEPFGIAPLEAMALDVPVIVSKQSGVAEVLTHAPKVDFWDVDVMAAQILAVLTDPALRQKLVDGGRSDLEQMQWSARGQHVAQIYAEAVA